jgi:Lrp/AsnC family transcriptional regulator, regulator for asnA, asnC and gidA
MMSRAHQLDELDRKIIDILAEDGRISNRRIAAQLGVTEGTIRGRIKRLEDDDCIRLTAVTNISGAGWPRVALIGVHAAHSELKTLCRELAAMPEVGCVILCLGRFDILAIGLFKTLEHVAEVANNRILSLAGVRHVETSIAVKTIKYDYRAAKITPRRKVAK